MPDPWTDAWAEAEASLPPTVDMYCTIELKHPAFVENGVPFSVRAVAGSYSSIMAGIELGAELNPGEMVEFKPIPFYADKPEFQEGKTPECRITVDSIGDELIPYLEAATKIRADMVSIYREYRSDDMTAPCYGPVEFLIKQVTLKSSTIEGIGKIDDLVNKKFPSRVYTYSEYSGLVA